MIEAAVSADEAPSGGGGAAAHFAALCRTIADLCPGTEPVTATGKEQERLGRLRQAAGHLLLLPRARGPLGQPDPEAETLRYKDAARLRQQTAATLGLLAEHAAAEVRGGIERALTQWDQAGNLQLLSPAGRQAALAMHERTGAALAAVLAAGSRTPALCALLAAAAEAITAVDAGCALLRAIEVRFVFLLRERLRQQLDGRPATPAAEREALLPGGGPFLDPGGGLLLLARAFGYEAEAGDVG